MVIDRYLFERHHCETPQGIIDRTGTTVAGDRKKNPRSQRRGEAESRSSVRSETRCLSFDPRRTPAVFGCRRNRGEGARGPRRGSVLVPPAQAVSLPPPLKQADATGTPLGPRSFAQQPHHEAVLSTEAR